MRKKISQSIRAKTFLGLLALLVVCCAAIYGMVMIFLPRNYYIDLKGQITADFDALVESLEETGWEDGQDRLHAFAAKNHALVNVINRDGKNVFSVNYGDKRETDTEHHPNGDRINIASTVPTEGFASGFYYKGETYYILATAALMTAVSPLAVLMRLIPLIAGMILLISALGAYLTARAYAKPLVEISGAAQRMATLDFSGQCKVARRDEIGTLAKSLNEMSAQLQQALDSLQAANAQLQQDIERERAQEKQRVEFFTAVSHELKTPLAILKGQLEGMVWQVGEYKDRDTWLRRCLQTTDRMEALVREILAAARMGSGDFSPARADLDLSALLNAVCETFRAPAQDKGLTLRLYIAPGVQGRGDRRLLEKAFANVVGNAVAYSPPGAVVTVALQDGAFTVENTGVHIAEDDLPHLFTPFYRVEKSRSRNSGGSGLGLYITKTILDRHGAACRIENTPDGVRFTAAWGRKKLKIKK